MKKKVLIPVIAVLVVILLAGTAFATVGSTQLAAYYRDIQVLFRNGNTLAQNVTDELKDVNGEVKEAFIVDGTTYVPLRGISEVLGYDVGWDAESNTITISGYSHYYTDPANDYTIIPVKMYMQAGHEQWEAWETGKFTVHAGEGYIDPFGVGTYTMGIGYPEQTEEFQAGVWMTDWWKSAFCGGSFCMYQMQDGDIYCLDGVYGNITPNYMTAEDGQEYNYGREDSLINFIVGGTGAYEGATGIMIGHTPSCGSQANPGPMVLPQALFKFMEGYIKIPDDPSTVNYVEDVEDVSTAPLVEFKDDATTIEVNMTMKAGSSEYKDHTSGMAIHSGIGYMYPFGYGGDSSYTAGINYDEEKAWGSPSDYFKQNFIDEYNATLFCVYTTEGLGDLIVYDGLWGSMLAEDPETAGDPGTQAQRQDALVNVVIGGTGDFEGCTGILIGKTMGAGEYSTVGANWNPNYTLPSTLLKVMTGYVKMDSDCGVYAEYSTAGGFLN